MATPSKAHQKLAADFAKALAELSKHTDVVNPNVALAALVNALVPVPVGYHTDAHDKRAILHEIAHNTYHSETKE